MQKKCVHPYLYHHLKWLKLGSGAPKQVQMIRKSIDYPGRVPPSRKFRNLVCFGLSVVTSCKYQNILRRKIIDVRESERHYNPFPSNSKCIVPLSDGSSTNWENYRPLAIYLGQVVRPNSADRKMLIQVSKNPRVTSRHRQNSLATINIEVLSERDCTNLANMGGQEGRSLCFQKGISRETDVCQTTPG